MSLYEFPTGPSARTYGVDLLGTRYQLLYTFSSENNTWMLDISDIYNTPIVTSIPLVTGADLLDTLGYLGIGGKLVAAMDTGVSPPGFSTMGTLGHLYFVTP